MGLENTGFAIANESELWIDPLDYRAELAEGVDILASARVNVSVYNLQRCVFDHSVWSYAAQSISDLEERICQRIRPLHSKKIDAAVSSLQVAHAEVGGISPILATLAPVTDASRFSQGRIPSAAVIAFAHVCAGLWYFRIFWFH